MAAQTGLPGQGADTAAAAGDINKDGAPDFVFAAAKTPAAIATSASPGRFLVEAAPDGTAGATALQLFDYDNDGLLDLLAFHQAAHGCGGISGRRGRTSRPPRCRPTLGVTGDVPVAFSIGDIDADGDYDVVARFQSGGLRFWRSNQDTSGDRNSAIRVRLDARVSNRTAAGAKVEMRAGSLRHRYESSAATPPAGPGDIVFGIGRRARADVVRVLGLLEFFRPKPIPDRTIAVIELDRKPSSCPFLFTWNGSRFEFVSDFMGGGEMGAWIAPGVRNVPDPGRIRPDPRRSAHRAERALRAARDKRARRSPLCRSPSASGRDPPGRRGYLSG